MFIRHLVLGLHRSCYCCCCCLLLLPPPPPPPPPPPQPLGDDLGVWIAGIPRLNDVHAQQQRRRCGRNRSDETPGGKIHREHAEDGPPRHDAPRSCHTVDPVRDGDPDRVPLWKLGGHRTCLGVTQVEAHESQAVKGRILRVGEEQIACGLRHRCRDAVHRDERLALSDLNAFVDVDAGVPAANDVFSRGCREVHPRADGDEPHRQQRTPVRLARGRPEPQVPERRPREQAREHRVAPDQRRECIGTHGSEEKGYRGRDADADDDRPEHPLIGRQRRPLRAIADGSRNRIAPGRKAMAIRLAIVSIAGRWPRSLQPRGPIVRQTSSRACRPIASAIDRSRMTCSIAAASARLLRSGTRRAVVPSVATAVIPPTRVETSGVPDAMISITMFGRPSTLPAVSCTEGATAMSAAASSAGTSWWGTTPRDCTMSATPAASARA